MLCGLELTAAVSEVRVCEAASEVSCDSWIALL